MYATEPKKPARQFDLIAFDWDGTLFDLSLIHIFCAACSMKLSDSILE